MAPDYQRLDRIGTYNRRTETVIRELILNGSLEAGERINEVTLSQSLGISRGPLREAIQRLAAEGLLTLVSHRGAFVRTFERREVDELYDLRTALEMYAVRLACLRATDEELDELGQLVRAAEKTLTETPDAAYPPERDLHYRIIELARNQTLARAAQDAERQITLARRKSAQVPARAHQALGEHTDIVAALLRRDEDAAAAEMRHHLNQARFSALQTLGFDADEEQE